MVFNSFPTTIFGEGLAPAQPLGIESNPGWGPIMEKITLSSQVLTQANTTQAPVVDPATLTERLYVPAISGQPGCAAQFTFLPSQTRVQNSDLCLLLPVSGLGLAIPASQSRQDPDTPGVYPYYMPNTHWTEKIGSIGATQNMDTNTQTLRPGTEYPTNIVTIKIKPHYSGDQDNPIIPNSLPDLSGMESMNILGSIRHPEALDAIDLERLNRGLNFFNNFKFKPFQVPATTPFHDILGVSSLTPAATGTVNPSDMVTIMPEELIIMNPMPGVLQVRVGFMFVEQDIPGSLLWTLHPLYLAMGDHHYMSIEFLWAQAWFTQTASEVDQHLKFQVVSRSDIQWVPESGPDTEMNVYMKIATIAGIGALIILTAGPDPSDVLWIGLLAKSGAWRNGVSPTIVTYGP